MSDVFLSYHRSTDAQAQTLAIVLRGLGYEVWLDEQLPAHRAYGDVIAEHLAAAKAVVVVWSAEAARSEWVRSEANAGREAHKLVQLTVDRAKLPMPFDQIQCADLSNWTGDPMDAGWRKVADSVAELIGHTAVAPVTEPPLALPSKPSIAVLPFNNMSKDPDQEFFADGVVEAITATLSRIRSFFVIARNSAFRYKGKAVNLTDVGRELGVRYILEGSVQKAGDRVRITVQLIDAVGNAHIWADHFDGPLDDLFDLQDKITERVAGALQPSIRLAEIERARRKRPQDLDAYDYAMRAMPLVWSLEIDASAQAVVLLERALAIDPDYPLALSLAGWCHAQQLVYNWTDDIDAERRAALSHAERAAELSVDDPLILAVLGAVHTLLRNYGTARVLLERAVALDPNAAWACSRLGWLETVSDHPDRALEYFQRALRLSPFDPMNFNNYVGMATANEVAERYDDAVALYRRGLQERPHAVWILRHLVSALVGAGRMEEAAVEFARLCASYPDLTIAKVRKAMNFSPATLDRITSRLRTIGLPE